MNLTIAEDDIIARLTSCITPKLDIRSWPSDLNKYINANPNGGLIVQYLGDSYSEPEPNDENVIIQERRIIWGIGIIRKNLKFRDAHQGNYDLIEDVRKTLTGYTISCLDDASVLWPEGTRFVAYDKGKWVYTKTFAMTFPESEV